MTKLLVSIGTLSSGGAERVLSILSNDFASHYDEVIYLTWIDIPDFYQINQKVRRICVEKESKSNNLFKKTIWFRNFVKHENPTVILSFLAPFNVLVSFALMGVKRKLIVAERNDPRYIWNGIIQKRLRNLAYQMADGILVQTENNKLYFQGTLFTKTSVIYNPIIMADDYVGCAINTPKKQRIVAVARLTAQKNPEMLLLSFKEFYTSHPNYTLTIYGEGPYRPYIEKMVKELGLSGIVHLPGAVKNVWDNIKDAECFLMSSFYEGMPNALLEAMCLGLPCISTKVSGAVDLINNGNNGILIDLNDKMAMSKALCEVVDNKILNKTLAVNASKLYKLLKIDIVSNLWLDYIDKIILA